MKRLFILCVAATLATMSVPMPAAQAGFLYATALNGTTNGSLQDMTGQIVFQATSSASGQSFDNSGGSGTAMFQVVNQIVTPTGMQGAGNTGANAKITITISDGMGDSGTITVSDSTTGSFEDDGSSALEDTLTMQSSATFQVGLATFTFQGFVGAFPSGNPGELDFSYGGSGSAAYSAPLLAEFGFSGPTIVPEPSSALLAALGLAGVALVGAANRRRRGRSLAA